MISDTKLGPKEVACNGRGQASPDRSDSGPVTIDAQIDRLAECPHHDGVDCIGAERLHESVGRVNETLDRIDQRLTRLEEETQRIRSDDEALADLLRRSRDLAERFHEREVMIPVAMGLIALADRCRVQEEESKLELRQARNCGRNDAMRAARHIIECRRCDRIETEELLAQLSVESFTVQGEHFLPSSQRCLRRIASATPSLHGKVARSLRPGYRRFGVVIRPELVAIYVHERPSIKKGA